MSLALSGQQTPHFGPPPPPMLDYATFADSDSLYFSLGGTGY
jgi:hypothetical protein